MRKLWVGIVVVCAVGGVGLAARAADVIDVVLNGQNVRDAARSVREL
jgi:hypothetical protein